MMNTKKGFWIVTSILVVFMTGLLTFTIIPIIKDFQHGKDVLKDEKHLQLYYNRIALEYETAFKNGTYQDYYNNLDVDGAGMDTIVVGGKTHTLRTGKYFVTRPVDNSKIIFTYYCDKGDHSMRLTERVEIKPSKQNPTTTPRSNQDVK